MTAGRKPWYRSVYIVLPLLFGAFLILILPGASVYYRYSGGRSCARCHEIWQPYTDWHTSTHRNVPCADCHGDVFTFDLGFHLKNIRRLSAHLRGEIPEQVRLKSEDVLRMGSRCQKCHQQEYADWAAGPHAASYKEIFLDADHNHREHLMDDCLRCHAMHFNGSIRDLVTPLDTKGPWRLRDPKLEEQIMRAGAGKRILAYHICDWLVPTHDLLLDRGMMGDGVIDLRSIRSLIERAGYHGPQEVEIFSAQNWWKRPGEEVLATCIERFLSTCT